MKKIGKIFLIFICSVVIFVLGFSHKDNKQPNTLYRVYLDSELIGTIKSRNELEEYINNQAEIIRNNIIDYKYKIDLIDTFNKYNKVGDIISYSAKDKINYLINNKNIFNISDADIEDLKIYQDKELYKLTLSDYENMKDYVEVNDIYMHVEDVYIPAGIEIKKVYTYNEEILSISEIYKKIVSKKAYSVAGYKFTIKSDNEEIEDIVLYTLDKDIFTEAIESLINIFVDEKVYVDYKQDNQPEIITTGSRIDNIYIQEEITYKAVNVSVDEKIYTNPKDLSAYLLYGDTFTQSVIKVKSGDSIESLTLENKISVQEFLIFNDQYTSRENLLVPNTDVVIANIAPKIQVVVELYEVVDIETEYETIEKYDENMVQGNVIVTQEGKAGLERVRQNVKSINGEIKYVDPAGKELIKSSVPKIITIGTKYIPNVGSTASWGWPTNSGYTITSYYGYRLAIFGEGNFHSGIDIAGTGYGSPIRAANNGTIEILTNLGNTSYGKYIMINHNNGYYTLYAHLSGFAPGMAVGSTVSRGDVIGYLGSSGWSTGPHLHYEIRTCSKYACVTNPLNYYR